MRSWFGKLAMLALAAGAVVLVYALWQRREHELAPEPTWPPFAPVPTTDDVAPVRAPDPAPGWRAAAGDSCPDGYPVKVNVKSGIFHVPGGRFYDRIHADRCYGSAADAEADGYRASKS
jgi:hypothetical protein